MSELVIIFGVENFITTINFELLGNKSRETFAQEVSSSKHVRCFFVHFQRVSTEGVKCLKLTYHRDKSTAIKCRTLYVMSLAFFDLHIQVTE